MAAAAPPPAGARRTGGDLPLRRRQLARACLSSRSIAWSLEARFLSPSSPLTASSRRLGAEEHGHRVDAAALVELADPAAQPLLGHVDGLPGDVELDPEARQLGLRRFPLRGDAREGGAGADELRLDRVELLRGGLLLGRREVSRARSSAILFAGEAAPLAAGSVKPPKPQQYREPARCELARAPAHGAGPYQRSRLCDTGHKVDVSPVYVCAGVRQRLLASDPCDGAAPGPVTDSRTWRPFA